MFTVNFLSFGVLVSTIIGLAVAREDIHVSNITIGNPIITKWGTWGEWEYCPNGKYVVGMQLKTQLYQGIFKDDTGLNGIKFYCDTIGSNDATEIITSKVGNWGEYNNEYVCEGVATGFQLLSEKDLGGLNDDTAASNMRLFCDGKTRQGDGETWGDWTEPQYCNSKFAICGLRTQVEDPTSDNTALNNIQVLCCKVPDPAEFCVPVDSWDLILECDNLESTSDTQCTYQRKIGTGHWNQMSESHSIMHEVYGHVGFTIPGALVSLPGNFDSHLGFSSSTGYNWTQSSGEVWMEETTITVSLNVPPKVITRLYQTLGKCDFYTVRANKLKRVDTDERTRQQTVTYIDF